MAVFDGRIFDARIFDTGAPRPDPIAAALAELDRNKSFWGKPQRYGRVRG